jgi:hypothetical protein
MRTRLSGIMLLFCAFSFAHPLRSAAQDLICILQDKMIKRPRPFFYVIYCQAQFLKNVHRGVVAFRNTGHNTG